MHDFAWAKVVQIFWRVTIDRRSASTAVVSSEARSEARSGPREPWYDHLAGEDGSASGPSPRSVPCVMTTGPPMTTPSTFAGAGAFARAISSPNSACSTRVAPRPPYSGHEKPAQPASKSTLRQVRRGRRRRLAGRLLTGVVIGQPGSELVAESLLGRREGYIMACNVPGSTQCGPPSDIPRRLPAALMGPPCVVAASQRARRPRRSARGSDKGFVAATHRRIVGGAGFRR